MKYLIIIFIISLIFFIPTLIFATPANYISGKASAREAKLYIEAKEVSGRYLINRDAKLWLKEIPGKSALDYGSGLGYSSEFLDKQGFKTIGVDINPHMIKAAMEVYPTGNFVLIPKNQLPFSDQSFDVVYSSLVLFEIDSLDNIRQYPAAAAKSDTSRSTATAACSRAQWSPSISTGSSRSRSYATATAAAAAAGILKTGATTTNSVPAQSARSTQQTATAISP